MAEAARRRDGADIAAQALAMKEQMRANILRRFRESDTGKDMARAYDAVIRGMAGPANDIYRRVFEQGWFGKDVFDGRFHMDNSQGREDRSVEGMKDQYDTRAAFYGWDNAPGNGDQEKAQEQQQKEQSYEMEHDHDNDIGM